LAFGLALLGILCVILGYLGAGYRHFGLLVSYSTLSFTWVVLSVIHVTAMERLIGVPDNEVGVFLLGKTLIKPDQADAERVKYVLNQHLS
jgi:hypothetical protein